MKKSELTILAPGNHLGGTNLDVQMEQYILQRKRGGIDIGVQKRTWEGLMLAVPGIAAVETLLLVKVKILI